MLMVKALFTWLLWIPFSPIIGIFWLMFGSPKMRFYDHILPLKGEEEILICGYCNTELQKEDSGYSGSHKWWCTDKIGNTSLIVHVGQRDRRISETLAL